jgi:hypothetical protein
MRSIQVLGKKVTGWQILPIDAPDFEETAMCPCELILAAIPALAKCRGAGRAATSKRKKTEKII